ncbi:type VII secretion-associated serine protease mycosin [Streptomyces sp. SID14478]|uniref:type VII secretion-associated serine protease mycosin n=1 Tax=Streptomyces sp. SID14478 TaxID=2706073 RepID=UPI0013DEC1CE|nr:type VII secretion-associated serine protease mycosin [Streptomyces sp. SID14478]NEB82283.1 type VII secretion-associated serine protease mycosin [Streptomyces sp. SID14478]
MPSTSMRRRGAAATAILGALLVGLAADPAQADTTRSQQWFLDAMQAENMWKTSTGEGVTVAVIDTGVDASNPDLKGRVLDGLDLASNLENGDEHSDYEGHGTGMAGLIAGTGAYNGGKGAFGLAPGAKILPIRMPDISKGVMPFEESTQLVKAIRYAADSGANVINISLGGTNSEFEALAPAVKYALQKGSLVFAASGNSGDKGNKLEYPAATPGVVAVGAVGEDLHRAKFSTYGPQVDLSAPGVDMVHACGGSTGLCKSEGTSDATALASASAALIWSKHPTWTNNQVLRVMLNTIGAPTDGAKRNDSIGYGIVRPRIALKTPGDPGPADKFPMSDYPVAAKTPSSEASKATGGETREEGKAAAARDAKDDGSNTGMWIGLGVAAVVVIGGAAAFAVSRRRRRDQQLPPPGAPMPQNYPGGPYGAPQQQPYSNQQFTGQPGQQPYGGYSQGDNLQNPRQGS